MNILILAENCEKYYAKVHEAYRDGLKHMFNAKTYGKGYKLFDPLIRNCEDIKQLVFPNEKIDLLILADGWDVDEGCSYSGLDKVSCKKAILACDFWSEADARFDKYCNFIKRNNIDYLLTFFRYPFHEWRNTELYEKLIWFPPSIDPKIFNDWGLKKEWDVGNLNAGIDEKWNFYPERYDMHMRLLEMEDITYFWHKHPGSGFHVDNTPLIGKSFSEAINRCKIFVTSGNQEYGNFTPKYVEIMASRTCLFATGIVDEKMIGLKDGYNYVRITSDNFEDKIRYYLKNDDEREYIASNGYLLAMEHYNCYSLAVRLVSQLITDQFLRGNTRW